mgnify:FL=1
MSFRGLSLALLLWVSSSAAWSQEFIVSKDLKFEIPEPAAIIHSGESVFLKYTDWSLSHTVLNPKTFYTGVDLTGLLEAYIRTIFEPEKSELVNWLQFMAKEQAKAFKLTDKNTQKVSLGNFTLYSVFDSSDKNGHIFLVGKDYISHFNILSDKKNYSNFIKLLKGRL